MTFSRKFVSSLIWERNSAITLQIFTNFMSNWQKNPNFRVSEIAKNVIFCQIWHFSLSNLAKTHIFPFSNFQNPSFDIWCLWSVTFSRKFVSRFYFCEILEWFERISLWNYQKELIWRKNWHEICENLQLQFTNLWSESRKADESHSNFSQTLWNEFRKLRNHTPIFHKLVLWI